MNSKQPQQMQTQNTKQPQSQTQNVKQPQSQTQNTKQPQPQTQNVKQPQALIQNQPPAQAVVVSNVTQPPKPPGVTKPKMKRAPRPRGAPGAAGLKRLIKVAPVDKSSPEFQQFIGQYFTNKRKYRPPAYANLVGEGNRCVPPTKLNKRGRAMKVIPKLSLHQLVVNTVMKILANNPQNTNRGLLAWHSTGSGKTLTATAVMDAFWETDRNIIYVSSVEGKNANAPEVFYANARKFLPRFKAKRFSSPDPEATIELVGREFRNRGVKFMTFAQLAHFLLIDHPLKVNDPAKKEMHRNYLDNAIVIMDEVHNIFKPLPNQRSECDALRKFLMDPKNARAQKMKLVVLTATPGDSPQDIVDLLNMVRDPTKPVVEAPDVADTSSMQKFRDSVRGLVSFFDMSGDMTKFPKVEQEADVLSKMSMAQFEEYVEAYLKTVANSKQNDYDKLAKANKGKKYMEFARKYSNMLFKVQDGQEVADFSAKLATLVERIQKYPNEKHYVYSNFFTAHGFGGQGIQAVAKVLKTALGYTQFKPSEATRDVIADPNSISSAPRFVLATTPALTKDSPNAAKNLKKLVDVFNSAKNSRGEKIHVFLASQGYNEGVDLRGVRHIHIFDPLVTIASEKQTIGRAARHCSHSDLNLDAGEWTVKVHRYYSDKPIDLDIMATERLRSRSTALINLIDEAKSQLELYKGRRGNGTSDARAAVKASISSKTKELKLVAKELKKMTKLNDERIEMVDFKIRKEALERMKTLAAIYQVVYDTSVDCPLFKDFHVAAGYNITCD